MVFQQFNLFPHKSVMDNVTLAQRTVLKRSGEEAHEKATALLERVGLSDKLGNTPSGCPAASNSGWRLPARSRWTHT